MRIGESYVTLRRYSPEFLAVLKLRAAPAAKDVLEAIEVLRSMNSDNARFIKPRWQKQAIWRHQLMCPPWADVNPLPQPLWAAAGRLYLLELRAQGRA